MKSNKILICFGLLLLVSAFQEAPHTCIHEKIETLLQPMEQTVDSERLLLGISDVETHPIRIKFDTRYIQNENKNFRDAIEFNIIPHLKQYLEKRLKVRRTSGPITFPYNSCGEAEIPQEYKDNGVADVDLVIFVQAENSQESFSAYASSCVYSEEVNNRPTVGRIVFNSRHHKVEVLTKDEIADKALGMFGVTLHETLHILVFSPSLFSKFVDKHGNPRENVIEEVEFRGKKTKILKTPKLVETARKHFGCESLKGIELENEGFGGTKGSHFERTVLHNEVITGNILSDKALSKFTMAVFEDSGWYVPNYEMADPFYWGKDAGCDFINKGCKGTNFREFCASPRSRGCGFNLNHIGYCTPDNLGDGCNYMKGYSNRDCRKSEDQAYSPSGQKNSDTSKCLASSLSKYSPGQEKPGCYQYSCNAEHTEVTIKTSDGKSALCKTAGEKISVEGYKGTLTCPDAKIFCLEYYPACPNFCSGYGHCFNAKCDCLPGRTGDDCSKIIEENDDEGNKKNDEGNKKNDEGNKNDEGKKNEEEKKCPNECNGNGDCIDGTCKCTGGYLGVDCSKFTCSRCKYGKCTGPEKCTCNDGWSGEMCNQPTCKSCVNGKCTEPNKCSCSIGWTGSDCSEKVKTCPGNCSPNGKCINGKCYCNTGYEGIDCNTKVTPKCPNDCNGKGKCQSNNMCLCISGYTGVDCSKQVTKPTSECPKDCNGNGKCYKGKCYCNREFAGEDCSKTNKCPNDCSRHGTCINSKCSCYGRYDGEDCSEKFKCLNDCSGNGKCNTYRKECYCYNGYDGEDCSKKSQCPNDCNKHGRCKIGKCYCNYGYEGDDCSKKFKCLNDCSGNGSCNLYRKKCYCYSGYYGEDCSKKSHCPNDCNKHGRCKSGKCKCYYGYSGEDCSKFKCINDCSGNGKCNVYLKKCQCNRGFYGDDCSKTSDACVTAEYTYDEKASNYRCKDNCQCTGLRICSNYGFCQK